VTTVDLLLAADSSSADDARLQQARRKLDDAETRLRRLQRAVEAGAEPGALVDALNRAHEERQAARADLDRLPAPRALGRAEIEAIVDQLGDVGAALNGAKPAELEELYSALGLEMVTTPARRSSTSASDPSVG